MSGHCFILQSTTQTANPNRLLPGLPFSYLAARPARLIVMGDACRDCTGELLARVVRGLFPISTETAAACQLAMVSARTSIRLFFEIDRNIAICR
jgi:hypothetical protein